MSSRINSIPNLIPRESKNSFCNCIIIDKILILIIIIGSVNNSGRNQKHLVNNIKHPFSVTKFEHSYYPNELSFLFKIALKSSRLIYTLSNSLAKEKIHSIKTNKTIYALIVDDEYMIRNSMIRLITSQLTKDTNLEVIFIEANDGIECLLAIYLATLKQIKIDFVITDENMTYINGSFASDIIKTVIKNGKFKDIPIFMSTALGKNINYSNPDIVKKVFSKPMDKNSIHDLLLLSGVIE